MAVRNSCVSFIARTGVLSMREISKPLWLTRFLQHRGCAAENDRGVVLPAVSKRSITAIVWRSTRSGWLPRELKRGDR
jgi:hypothetical protein